MAKTAVLGGLGQEALLVFVTKVSRNGTPWDFGWFVHILFEVGLREMNIRNLEPDLPKKHQRKNHLQNSSPVGSTRLPLIQ